MCNLHFCTNEIILLALLTLPVAPVIGSVAAIALSLSEVQVTVTLSDTGGQPVDYTVSQ